MQKGRINMADLLLYVFLAVVGYLIAGRLAKYQVNVAWIGKVQTVAIILLVFTMGTRIGSNEEVVSNLNMIGLYALVFTIVILICSIAAVFFVRKLMRMDRYGRFVDETEELENSGLAKELEDEKISGNTMSIIIVVTITIGLLVGYNLVDKIFPNMELFNTIAGNAIKVGLCLLLFLVGFEMGLEGTFIEDFKKAGVRVLAFPLAIAVGTLVGAFICGLFIPISMRESLAIGGGLGWYSLAPIVILEKGYVIGSAISFMHNVMRELFSMLFIPLVARKIGYVESIALPGSCASDVCLPIVSRSTRSGIAIYSFISGISLSAMVPIIVPILLGA